MIDLDALKNVDLKTVDRDTLVDIRDVNVNLELSKEERIVDFIRQIKNPYCFKVGKIIVKVSFNDNGPTLEEALINLLSTY